jgi:vacuolar-type H+-ATPase subunit E/Vma4
MSEEKLVEKIIEYSESEAQSMIAKAKDSARQILEGAQKRGEDDAREEAENALSRAKEGAETLKRQIVTQVRMKANWQGLSQKQELMEKVLAGAKEALRIWAEGDARYASALRGLIIRGGQELGGGELEVLLNPRDSKLNLDQLSKEIEGKTGVKTRIALGRGGIQVSGGAIVRTADGKMAIDNTFEGIMERHRRTIETATSRILYRD